MLPLKNFQERVLKELREILDDWSLVDQRVKEYHSPYGSQVRSLGIKIPTGGGKTLVAVHSLPLLLDKIKGKRTGLVLWLVPTDTIVRQTIKKFTDKDDFHKQYLDSFFDADVLVKDSGSIWNVAKNDLENHLVIFICTFAYFRISEDKAQMRKIWGSPADDKFGDYWDTVNLEKFKNKLYQYDEDNNKFLPYPTETDRFENTLANLIITQHPITVIDEIHRAKSPLSIDAIKRLNPWFVLKFSATPTEKDNVVIIVSGDELYKEYMIKLPINITINKNEDEVIEETIKKQRELENVARKIGIRPIVLIQAEKKSEKLFTFDVETIKKKLLDDFDIPKNQIAIAYKEKDEIFDIDLFDMVCPIRYILTVDKLREGWDCSFAYILCNLRNLTSPTAVEQIIGRVLRKYKAKPIGIEDLNRAYVFTIAKETTTKQDIHFKDVAKCVANALQNQNGYTEDDFYIEVIDKTKGDLKNNYFDIKLKEEYKKEMPNIKLYPLCLNNKQIRNQADFLIGFNLLKFDRTINVNSCLEDIEKEFEINPFEENQIKEVVTEYRKHKFEVDNNKKIKEIIIFISRKIPKIHYSLVYDYVKDVITSNVLDNDALGDEDRQKVLLNKWRLLNVIRGKVKELIDGYARKQWDKHVKDGSMGINKKMFLNIADEIKGVRLIKDDFKRHIYDKCPVLNSEERTLALKIDAAENVEWWVRNVEKKPTAFYLHGYLAGKFYPDFIIKTKDGRLFLVEYKGKQLDNKETEYRKAIGELWEKLNNKVFFRLVFKNTIQTILDEIDMDKGVERKLFVSDVLGEIDEALKYTEYLPVYSLAAAAGKFGEGSDVHEEGWVKANIGRKLNKKMFVAKVTGHSMEPLIPDNSYCVFRADVVGSRQGKIVLAQHHDIRDVDTRSRYTIKRYKSEKKFGKDDTWRHEKIILEPLNKEYDPIILSNNVEGKFKIIAEFVAVL
ncbi:MAG: DEAD/DEAH box helicase family protein [Candidatus Omnitrophica bacterium]|nr:DEAD/DEAH box helicase family protein [Candidatus Omnitrophota bacterium]